MRYILSPNIQEVPSSIPSPVRDDTDHYYPQVRIEPLADPACTPKGPNYFILTYKFFETWVCWELEPPMWLAPPPMGNPGFDTESVRFKRMSGVNI